MTKLTITSLRSHFQSHHFVQWNVGTLSNKSYSAATKSLKLSLVKLMVTGKLIEDFDSNEPMVEAVEIAMTIANCCFNSVEMAARTSLMGEDFLE